MRYTSSRRRLLKTNKKYKGGKKKRVGSRLGRHAAGERANGVHGMEEKRSGYGGPCRTEGAEAPCFFLWSVIYYKRTSSGMGYGMVSI